MMVAVPTDIPISVQLSAKLLSFEIILVTAAYHYGFWSPFDINIFSFTSLPDLAKLALWPLVVTVLTTTGGLLTGLTQYNRIQGSPSAEGLSKRRAFRMFINQEPAVIFGMLLIVAATVVFFQQGSPSRWTLLAGLLGVVATVLTMPARVISLASLPHRYSVSIVVLLTILPFSAWGVGRTNAEIILGGFNYWRATVRPELLTAAEIPQGTDLRFLANTGTHTILLVGSGPGVFVVSETEINSMKLDKVTKSY
jgi:hypothetical protein